MTSTSIVGNIPLAFLLKADKLWKFENNKNIKNPKLQNSKNKNVSEDGPWSAVYFFPPLLWLSIKNEASQFVSVGNKEIHVSNIKLASIHPIFILKQDLCSIIPL